MKIKFDITYNDGTKAEVTAHPRSFVVFEKMHRKSLSDSPSMSAMTWLAWHASGMPGTFDEWIETVDDVDADKKDEAATDPSEEESATPLYGS